jgi:hypothetical protein
MLTEGWHGVRTVSAAGVGWLPISLAADYIAGGLLWPPDASVDWRLSGISTPIWRR